MDGRIELATPADDGALFAACTKASSNLVLESDALLLIESPVKQEAAYEFWLS
jgi:hypothetical protein